jgi:hypothetical protein
MGRYEGETPARRISGEGPFLTGNLNQIYQHYFSRLLAVATTRYRWLGLGEWIDPARLEWLLVTQGLAAFTFVKQSEALPAELTKARTNYYEDANRRLADSGQQEIQSDRFTVTQAAVTGYLDDTYTPASYQTYAPNGAGGVRFRTTLPLEEWKGVPIWGDSNRSNYDARTIEYFAGRLASASLVVDTNLRQTMRGVVLATTQDKLKTKRVALDAALAGIDVMVADEDTIASLQALDFGVHPDTVERSHVIAMRLWAEALEALGVESPAAEKKERLITDEVNGDHSQIAAIRRLTLTPRRRAAELINRRYFDGAPVVEVVDQW